MHSPVFSAAGLLPAGDYVMTFPQLRGSMLVKGPTSGSPNWDAPWRGRLVDNLNSVVRTLWELGIEYVIIDGSFVEQKDHPNDIDAYFPVTAKRWVSREVERELNRKRSENVWTWDWRYASVPVDPRVPHRRLPFWHKYRIDLFPNFGAKAILHERLGWLTFEDGFRHTRSGAPKGVVKVLRPG